MHNIQRQIKRKIELDKGKYRVDLVKEKDKDKIEVDQEKDRSRSR